MVAGGVERETQGAIVGGGCEAQRVADDVVEVDIFCVASNDQSGEVYTAHRAQWATMQFRDDVVFFLRLLGRVEKEREERETYGRVACCCQACV